MGKKYVALAGVVALAVFAFCMFAKSEDPVKNEKQIFIDEVLSQKLDDSENDKRNSSDTSHVGLDSRPEQDKYTDFDKKLEQKLEADMEKTSWTEAYKRYDALSDEEKSKYSGAIPGKYRVSLESLNSIEESQKDYDLTDKLKKNEEAAQKNPKKLASSTASGAWVDMNIVGSSGSDLGGESGAYQDPSSPISGAVEYDEYGLPDKYDLRNVMNLATDDQMHVGLCWDFASTNSVESFMYLHGMGEHNLSEVHANVITSQFFYNFHRLDDGGYFDDYKKYLSLSGVTDEQEGEYNRDLSSKYYEPDDTVGGLGAPDYNKYSFEDYYNRQTIDTHITKFVDFPTLDGELKSRMSETELKRNRAAIKKQIIENGSLYMSITANCMNRTAKTIYCKKAPSGTGHAMSIIGWVDDLDTSFIQDSEGNSPEHAGAYIIKNSWGDSVEYLYMPYDSYDGEADLHGIASNSIDDAIVLDEFKGDYFANLIRKKYGQYINTIDGREYIPNGLISFDLEPEVVLNAEDYEDYTRLGTVSGSMAISNFQGVDVEYLENFPNLYSLKLDSVNDLSNEVLSYIAERVQVFEIKNTKVESSDFLANIRNGSNLSFVNVDGLDLSKLPDGIELYSLSLNGCTNLRGLDRLGSLGQVDILALENMGLKSVNEFNIADSENIWSLSLAGNEMVDFSGVPKGLAMLNLTNNKLTSYPSGIDASMVTLSDNMIETISITSPDTSISMKNNQAMIKSVKSSEMSRLSLEDSPVESFDVFRGSKIGGLYLTHTGLSEITAIDSEINVLNMHENIEPDSLRDLRSITGLQYLSLYDMNSADVSVFNDFEGLLSITFGDSVAVSGLYSGNAEFLTAFGDVSGMRLSSDCNLRFLDFGMISEKYLHKVKSWNAMNPNFSEISYSLDSDDVPLSVEQYGSMGGAESEYSFYNSNETISKNQLLRRKKSSIIEIPVSRNQKEYFPQIGTKIQRIIFNNIGHGGSDGFSYGKASIKASDGSLAGKEMDTFYAEDNVVDNLTIRFVTAE